MRRGLCAMVTACVASGMLLASAEPVWAKSGKKDRGVVERRGDHRTEVHVTFSKHEIDIVRDYYRPRYRNLPPGLQKKYARTGQLPPGWQKKMEPFPVALERRMVVLPPDHHRGVIDGHAVIYNRRTNAIIDVSVLF